MKSAKRALVVGGGVIGLTSAFQLARQGWLVTVFDPAPGRGATWAAAGMIAPIAEIGPGEEQNFELQRGALDAWRRFAKELAEVTHQELCIVEHGTLLVGWDGSDRRLVEQFARCRRNSASCPSASLERTDPRCSKESRRGFRTDSSWVATLGSTPTSCRARERGE